MFRHYRVIERMVYMVHAVRGTNTHWMFCYYSIGIRIRIYSEYTDGIEHLGLLKPLLKSIWANMLTPYFALLDSIVGNRNSVG